MTSDVLFMAFVYLGAAVLSVPIAKRLGLGSVLGYLLAGVAIGPFVLGFVGHEGHGVMHFAEFGVVMMLFLVGLELRPAMLWQLRRPILGLGGAAQHSVRHREQIGTERLERHRVDHAASFSIRSRAVGVRSSRTGHTCMTTVASRV